MRLVSFQAAADSPVRPGVLVGAEVFDLLALETSDERDVTLGGTSRFFSMIEFLAESEGAIEWARDALDRLTAREERLAAARDFGFVHALDRVRLRAPLLFPPSVRDFYAFEEHVRRARARRGLGIPAEWYESPAFYFSNPAAIFGPGDEIPYPRGTAALDYELEVACVIGRAGRDVTVATAPSHVAGFTIMNDWSARDLQRREMAVGLGPAKGKDFATSLGPMLVTTDELDDRRSERAYDLAMVARVNGVEYSRGNLADIHWSFAELISHASENTTLLPGDVIGSGCVGSGCLLELGNDWLKAGDVVELEVERLGVLRNTISDTRKITSLQSQI